MYNKTDRKLITPEWWREWLAQIYASHHFNIIINQKIITDLFKGSYCFVDVVPEPFYLRTQTCQAIRI